MNIVDKIWGREIWIENNRNYCHKKLIIKEGYTSSYHHHKIKDETFYVESGKVAIELEGRMVLLNEFEKIRILPNMNHRFVGIEDSVITEVSTHHEDSDSYRTEGKLSRRLNEDEMQKIMEGLGMDIPSALFER